METKRRQVIEEDLANVEFETSEDVDVVPTFDSMGLREDLLRGIYAYGKIEKLRLISCCERSYFLKIRSCFLPGLAGAEGIE